MTYYELLDAASELAVKKAPRGKRVGLRRRHAEFLEAFLDLIKKTVHKQGRLVIPAFVTFNVKTLVALKVRNPITNDWILLPRRKTVKVRASSDWRNVQ